MHFLAVAARWCDDLSAPLRAGNSLQRQLAEQARDLTYYQRWHAKGWSCSETAWTTPLKLHAGGSVEAAADPALGHAGAEYRGRKNGAARGGARLPIDLPPSNSSRHPGEAGCQRAGRT